MSVVHALFVLNLSVITLLLPQAAPAQPAAPATSGPDPRPRVAVVNFRAAADADPRDTWVPTALEELLSRRLQRVPELLLVPTVRLYQARRELAETPSDSPAWDAVVRGLGAGFLVQAECRGPEAAVELSLKLESLADGKRVEFTTSGRLVPVLDAATMWVLERFGVPIDDSRRAQWLAPPARSLNTLEYYARAVLAARAENEREALRYGIQSYDADKHFRPVLLLLANIELQLGEDGRINAARRLRALSDLSRFESDPFDRARAEIGHSLMLQAEGGFEAAYLRAETALAIAFEQRDLYGQMAAITAICDSFLLRPLPAQPALDAAARDRYARACLREAADWQALLVDQLAELNDLLAGLPAVNKLALICERIDQPERAAELHRRALEMAKALGSRRHQATAWLYLGHWNAAQKRWADALDAFTRCLALADDDSKPGVRMALGGVYRAMELHDESLAQFEQAYAAVRTGEELVDQFTCLREIATTRMRLGRRDEAIKALQEAIDIAHVLELRDESTLREELERWKSGGS